MYEMQSYGSEDMCRVDNEKHYNYLLCHTLCSVLNMRKLRERVREVYMEMVANSDHDIIPSLHAIAEYIDEENIVTIYEFCKLSGYSEDKIDDMVAKYNHNVSCMLDDWIEEVLTDYGFAYTGTSFYVMHENKSSIIHKSQNLLFKEFLR